ncbi:three-Cys-motif partner protein [Thermoanaerobacter thermohydrosulfuricus]|nr:three-Cys-motif partner protein [Thermoanaerobacter thermohydrosulfuricus]
MANEKKYIEGYPFYFWEIKDHTKVKHRVFAEYFDKYVKIVGEHHNINYIDCFGGCGAYIDEKQNIYFGSPILAAFIAQENIEKLNRKIKIFVVDTDKENLENLQKIIEFKNITIPIELINDNYKEGTEKVLQRYPHTPTFYLIDPFGYSLDYKFFKMTKNNKKSEILVNFMYNGLNRGISVEKVKQTINNLYGTDEWKKIKDLKGYEREKEAVSLFVKQIEKIFHYVKEYKIRFDDKDKTYYYLIHGCNHPKGIDVMSASFASHNDGNLEHKGPKQGQISLLENMEYRIQEISEFLLQKYKGQQVSFLQISIEGIKEGYISSFVRKTLYKLEEEGKIQIIRIPPYTSKKRERKSIEENDIIVFKE